jgi:signal transduction histidine kinase
VSTAIALCGWVAASGLLVALLRLRGRLELVARADHELRGSVTVLSLAAERLRRMPGARRQVEPLELELERLRTALADLAAARRGRRATDSPALVMLEPLARGALGAWASELGAQGREAKVDWNAAGASVRAAPGRLAQALGNLMANAVEHGDGSVEVRGRRTSGGVRLEVRNALARGRTLAGPGEDRGRGLSIASSAAEAAGGALRFESRDGKAIAALELPVDRRTARPRTRTRV